jgi:predicted SAM-dependent methyltransferase
LVHPERCLNLGCGRRFHPHWVNIDAHPVHPSISPHDVTAGLPFPEASFDVVYHSHLLEHLPPEDGEALLRECCRVLAPGGVVRVVVPDLEGIARLYLESLHHAKTGDVLSEHNYDWMLIEMYDQSVREFTGGRHGTYLNRDVIPNVQFVIGRQGREVEDSIEGQRLLRVSASGRTLSLPIAGGTMTNVRARLSPLRRALRAARQGDWRRFREWMVRLLLREDYALLQLGRFRRSGEIHHWMYDSFSLARALRRAGFIAPLRRGADESRIQGWPAFELDTDDAGRICKPDSLYMEAVKPGSSPVPREQR